MKKVRVSIDDKTYEYEVEEKDVDTLFKIIDIFSKKNKVI